MVKVNINKVKDSWKYFVEIYDDTEKLRLRLESISIELGYPLDPGIATLTYDGEKVLAGFNL